MEWGLQAGTVDFPTVPLQRKFAFPATRNGFLPLRLRHSSFRKDLSVVFRYMQFMLAGAFLAGALQAGTPVVGVLPYAAGSMEKQVAEATAVSVGEMLSVQASVLDLADVQSAGDESPCDGPNPCEDLSCAAETGRRSGADYILCMRFDQEGPGAYVVIARLYDVNDRQEIWSRGYQVNGGPDTLITDLPSALANNFPFGELTTDEVHIVPAPKQTIVKADEGTFDNGISSAIALGVQGYTSVGLAKRQQSPGGFLVYGVMPTGPTSQARVRTGMPLFYSTDVVDSLSRALPPVYFAAEHEWGWRYFGVAGGLSYIYFPRFTKQWTYYRAGYHSFGYSDYAYTIKEPYPVAHGFNATLGIRGGKPHGGFIGRISWPLGFTVQGKSEQNYLFDYSAFGVFSAGPRYKIGFGLRGAFIRREMDPDSAIYVDSTFLSSVNPLVNPAYDRYSTNQFCSMVPTMKLAALIGKDLVASFGIELGGLIFPRTEIEAAFVTDNYESDPNWWKPSISGSITFGLGPLKGPHVYDGVF